jgi:hypothetical protein
MGVYLLVSCIFIKFLFKSFNKSKTLRFIVNEKYYFEFNFKNNDDIIFINIFRVSTNRKITLFSQN